MGREVHFGQESFILTLRGPVAFFALKQKIEIPYQCVKSVNVNYFDAPLWMLRLPGTAIPPSIYEGSYKYGDEWYFLSYERRVPLIILRLEGHKKYNHVIFQMKEPEKTAEEIKQNIKSAVL
jgi:hypothetical protein